jgi:L-threonylcarbamoyladenylate synthase
MTELYAVESARPDPTSIARAAAVLRAGGLVAFPTETVYGLGANALDPVAVKRIFAAKGRPVNNPLIVHVASVAAARELVADWPETAEQLAARFWPGPLTLVLPKREIVPDIVTAGAATVGVRLPAHPVAHAIIEAAGVPIAAPSANRSNEVSPTTAAHVLKSLGDQVDVVLDGGATPGGLESTVLDLASDQPQLLRPGLVLPGEIEQVIGQIERSTTLAPDHGRPLASPGQLPRHYAPRAALECCSGIGRQRVEALANQGIRVGWLTFGHLADSRINGATIMTMPSGPSDYGAELYAALHALDDSGVQRIVVDLPPDTEPWLAIRDRLRRGSVQ